MLSIHDWIEAVRFRWRLVALVTGLIVAGAVLYVARAPRTYTATASLLLNADAPGPLSEDKQGARTQTIREAMATQADLVRSPHVAGNAASISGIAADPRYVAAWRQETGGRQRYAEWLQDRLRGALTVEPGRDTNVLLIQASASDPVQAAKIANGFARASVDSQYRLRTEPAKAYATWLEARLGLARNNVMQAQNALSGFVRATGITNDGDLSSEGTQMAEVANQLAAAEARAAASRQGGFDNVQARGDAEKSESIQRLRAQVAERTSKLAELESVYRADYPAVQQSRLELATLRSSLRSEETNAISAYRSARAGVRNAERSAATASEQRLRGLASAQRGRMLAMGSNLAQHTRLRSEFEAAQRTYNDLNTRANRMRMQSAVPLTEVQVLDIAAAPPAPSSPNIGLLLALAVVLGGLLGVGAAIWLEYRDPRVRSRSGIQKMLGVPVIGRIALPTMRPALGTRRGGSTLLLEGKAA